MAREGKIWEVLPRLFQEVLAAHKQAGMIGGAHDIYHAMRVAQVAYHVVPDGEERAAILAGAAGLCHNADHILGKGLEQDGTELEKGERARRVAELVHEWLSASGEITEPGEVVPVVEAVLGHTGRNSESDSLVKVALMDADRVVNLDLDLVPRAGQYRPQLPVIDFTHWLSDPTANYPNPNSIFRDIYHSLEWAAEPGSNPFTIRLPRARAMAEQRAARLRRFLVETLEQVREEGVYPDPLATTGSPIHWWET